LGEIKIRKRFTAKNKIPTFLKWAGGKRKLIKQLERYFPSKINNYFEPFLGGGSLFFYVKQKYTPKKCMISDVNEDLIETFKTVRDNPQKLIHYLERFKQKNSEEFYYKTRTIFNKKQVTEIKRSAAFIYLNKTCFNGLYRVNSRNEFNVPYANYVNPEIFKKENILLASELLQRVDIIKQDYRNILKYADTGDFVYLDPCYDPLSRTSFDQYTPDRFCERDRIELARFIYGLKKRKCFFLLSNNNLQEIRDLYSDFNVQKIISNRCISADGTKRKKITELAISNLRR